MHRLQLEEQLSKLCISQLFWDNLADGIFPRHKLQGVFTEVYEYMHVVLYLARRSAFFVPACVFLVRVGSAGRFISGKTVPKVLSTGT